MSRSSLLAIMSTLLGSAALTPLPADAAVTLTNSSTTGSAIAGANYENFNGTPVSGLSVNFVTDAAYVSGNSSNFYAAPFVHANNDDHFDNTSDALANGGNGRKDTTQYVTTGSTGNFVGAKIELIFSGVQNYFGLLWGSVDSYNTLSFYNDLSPVGTFTGTTVLAAASGSQDFGGSVYANFSGLYNRVVATSSQYAFEIDNVAFVPLPGAALLFGSALAGLGWMRRRRSDAEGFALAA